MTSNNYFGINVAIIVTHVPCKYATLVVPSDIILFTLSNHTSELLACSNITGKLHIFKDYFVYQVIMITIIIFTVDSYFRL